MPCTSALEFLQKALESPAQNGISKQDILLQLKLLTVWKQWRSIIGEPAADLCEPLGARSNTLLVGVQDSSALYELQFYKEDIIQRVNEYLGFQHFTKLYVRQQMDEMSLQQLQDME